jgi:hypothetical protein
LARTAATAATAASVASRPSGQIAVAFASASAYQASCSAAAVKNAVTCSSPMPGLPERSGTEPTQAITSSMSWRVGSSWAAEATVITPSPLKAVLAKSAAVSARSSTVMVGSLGRPRLASTCRAAECKVAPSLSRVSMASSDSAPASARRASADLRLRPTKASAASTSGTRMRPSLSVSMRAAVRASNSSPAVGQARATHSFWSSSPSRSRSCPVVSLT